MKTNRLPIVTGMLALQALLAPLNIFAQDIVALDHTGNELYHGPGLADGRGNRVHGSLPPATLGGGGGGSVATGNGINYNGGYVLHTVNVYFIWYGDWTKDPGANAILTGYAQNVGGSPYFNINTTYGDTNGNVPNAVNYITSYADPGSQGTSLSDGSIYNIVANALKSGKLGPTDPNGVYFVLTAPGIAETSGFLSKYCGWHTAGYFNGIGTQYSFVGDAGQQYGCTEQMNSSPNNDPPADAMATVLAHELEESSTDPFLNAWYDGNGQENADKCAWNFGTTYYAANGSLANMNLGGRDYLIQQNWVNAAGGYCALSYAVSPDFSLAPTPASQAVAPTGSTSYSVKANALGGYTGNVTLSVIGLPSGASASFATNPVAAGSGTSVLNVSTNGTAGGAYTLTIKGTDGTLTHTTTVTLNVGDFSVSASPSTRSIGQGSSTTYTASIFAVGGFSSSVAMSVSGLPAGATASFSPASVSGSGNSTLTINAGTLAAGTYPMTIIGTPSSGPSHSTPISLTVTSSDFTISATPASLSAGPGTNNLKYSVTVGSTGGFSGTVSFSVTGVPAGVTTSFSSASVNGSGNTSLNVNTGTGAPGTYTLNVTGTSNAHVHSTSVTLTILTSDFSLTPSQSNPSVKQGQSTTPTIALNSLYGFTGSVALSVTSPLPAGLTATLNPTSISGSNKSSLTLTTNGTPAGTYPLTVTGTNGSLIHTANLTLTVGLGGTLTITANPATVAVSRSSSTRSVTTLITITSSNGFAGNVTLTASGLPGGGTASFSPATVSVSQGLSATTTMTLSVSSTTNTGSSNVNVTGNSGGGGPQAHATIALQVAP